jgi:hypothetical protein
MNNRQMKRSGGVGWNIMSSVLLVLFVLASALQASDSGSRVQYVGGTMPGIRNKSAITIELSGGETLEIRSRAETVQIAYRDVNTLEYGLRMSRRYVEAALISPVFLVAKKKTHFLTIGFTDEAGQRQVMVLEVGKGDIRPLLVSLEARTGRRIEYQDEEARKAGRG